MLPPHQGLESRKADSLDMRIGQRLIHQLLIHQHQCGASFVEVPGCPTSGSANFVVRHSDSVGEDPVRNSSQVEIICLLAQRLAEPRHVAQRVRARTAEAVQRLCGIDHEHDGRRASFSLNCAEVASRHWHTRWDLD